MQKLWSLLFVLVPIFCVGLFVIAPAQNWWLPRNISTYGGNVDHLFMVILWIVTVAFLLTQGVLAYVLYRYVGTGTKAIFVHTNHLLEFWWTVIPAGILVFIALYQFKTWTNIKVQAKFPADVSERVAASRFDAEVLAGQFEWRIRYPGQDGKLGTIDDVISVNDLHVPEDENFVVRLRSRDVLHSFFLPNLRVKQDAVPGMAIPVWFQATEPGEFDLLCAELCGWGHYKMRGRLTVESAANHKAWLEKKWAEQEADKDPEPEVSQ